MYTSLLTTICIASLILFSPLAVSLVTHRLDNITKSEQDSAIYRHVVLENGLGALLVSDPSAQKAAAAMDVQVGYFADPDNIPGLAHLLEHMLFMGTAKYPDEAEYLAFLTAHGGSANAFTATDHTNFHFEVSVDFLSDILDR